MAFNLTLRSLLGLCALLFLFFSPIILSHRLIGNYDALAYHLPSFFGPVARWSHLLSCGTPTAADPQWETWYPLCRIFAFFRNFNAFVIAAYCIAACSMYLFLYDVTQSRIGAFIGAVSFSLSGFMTAHMGHAAIIQAAAWVPLMLFATRRFIVSRGWQWFILIEVATALCVLGGHVQVALLALVLLSSYTISLALGDRRNRITAFLSLALAMPLGLGMAAIQILPTFELASETVRAHLTFEEFVSNSLTPNRLAIFFFPFLYGGETSTLRSNVTYFGQWNLAELSCYMGITQSILATVALINNSFRGRWFWFGMFIMSILIAAGAASPISTLLYNIPVFNSFRCPARYVFVAEVCVAVLVAMGVSTIETCARGKERSKQATMSSLIVALISIVLLLVALRTVRHEFIASAAVHSKYSIHLVKELSIWFLSWILGSLTVYSFALSPKSRVITLLLVCLSVIDISSFGIFHSITRDDYLSPTILTQPLPVRTLAKELAETRYRFIEPLGIEDTTNMLGPDAYVLWGLPGLNAYGPLLLKRYHEFLSVDQIGNAHAALNYSDCSLDLASAKYIVVKKYGAQQSFPIIRTALSNSIRYQHLGDLLPGFELILNKRALSRFRFASSVVCIPKKAILGTIKTSILPSGEVYNPKTTALVEEIVPVQTAKAGSRASFTIVRDEDEHMTAQTDCSEQRFFIIADQYYPGWFCTIDGAPTNIYRTDYCLRGVVVPAGRHRIEQMYKPKSFALGLCITCGIIFLNLLLPFIFTFARPKRLAIFSVRALKAHIFTNEAH
jgi:hypothetical protein